MRSGWHRPKLHRPRFRGDLWVVGDADMGHAIYIGRVGALAVALGVGVAAATGYGIGNPAVAWAEEGSQSTDTSDTADKPSDDPADTDAPKPDSGADTGGAHLSGLDEDPDLDERQTPIWTRRRSGRGLRSRRGGHRAGCHHLDSGGAHPPDHHAADADPHPGRGHRHHGRDTRPTAAPRAADRLPRTR